MNKENKPGGEVEETKVIKPDEPKWEELPETKTPWKKVGPS